MLPDYLDVDSPSQRGKKEKKRRKVERNTKLSRSLDSLKELHGKETDLYTVYFQGWAIRNFSNNMDTFQV